MSNTKIRFKVFKKSLIIDFLFCAVMFTLLENKKFIDLVFSVRNFGWFIFIFLLVFTSVSALSLLIKIAVIFYSEPVPENLRSVSLVYEIDYLFNELFKSLYKSEYSRALELGMK